MTDAKDLIARIEAAFPAQRPSLEYPLAESRQSDEPEAVRQEFADKRNWTELSGEWLDAAPDGWSTALSFLSDEAVCFYLPAYLRADLCSELMTADPLFHLVHGFDNATMHTRSGGRDSISWHAYAARRWSRLTADQCGIVCSYLEWRLLQDELGVDYAATEALANYWRKRAGLF